MRIAPWLALASVAAALAACGRTERPAPPPQPPPTEPEISYQEMRPTAGYPLKTCVVTGKDLAAAGRSRFVIAYKGYEMQFCSKACLKEFAKDPKKYVRMMNPRAMFDD